MKKSLFLIVLSLYSLSLFSQGKYWVFFKDKDQVQFNPFEYFDSKAIQRRIIHQIPLFSYSDIPVNPQYIEQVNNLCDSISYSSRWFNALACYANEDQLKKISQLPFVSSVEIMESYTCNITSKKISLSDFNEGQKLLLFAQTNRMKAIYFKSATITGKGVRIAVLDAGFVGFKECEALRHSVNRDYIKSTFDFIKNDANVYRGHEHGTMVASCIAGKIDTVNLGLAPNAEFLLARTEKAFNDRIVEEERWIAAMEWADKNGADIINTSLGYTSTRYFRKDMNGRKGLISRAATMASSKGILVICSAGNEGDGEWKIVAAPGDADSVLTVGAINPWTGIHASWSSYGPSADKRIKPNVSAYGHTMVGYRNGYMEEAGTSFAAPLVAGFAACIMQLHPDWKNMDILSEIEKSSDLFPYYDYAHGYGVPQASYFFDSLKIKPDTTFDAKLEGKFLQVIIRKPFFSLAEPSQQNYFIKKLNFFYQKNSDDPAVPYHHIDDKAYNASSPYAYTKVPDYVFYHVKNKSGFLDYYFVISVHQQQVLNLDKDQFAKGDEVHVYYKGYTQIIQF